MEENLTKDEIFEIILEESKKEITLEKLSTDLNLTPLETFGYVAELQKIDKQLTISKKDNGITILNTGDLFYVIKDEKVLKTENGQKKIMLISDPRFGSKFFQKDFLNKMYLKALKKNCDTVFLLGNITEGLYNVNSKSEYYDDLYAQDTMKQVEDVIENYPYIEGITTYFILGPRDKQHLTKKKINIGKKISEEREDMIFLGTNHANIFVDNISIALQNLPLAKTYTISYRPEQSIKARRSEDKTNILIYGGLCQLESFTTRSILEFSVPSLVATTTEMNAKRYDNVIGAQFLTLYTDKLGFLKDYDYSDIQLYESSKDDYLKVKSLKLKKEDK